MTPRHRYRTTFALALVGAGLAWLLAAPLLLAIPVGVGGSLLARQLQFRRDLEALDDGLTISQSLDTRQVRANGSATLFIEVTGHDDLPVEVDLVPHVPAALSATAEPVPLADSGGTHSVPLEPEIAGRYTVGPPTLSVTGRDGLLRAETRLGDEATLVVTPPGPNEFHVGEGGERVATAQGGHPARTGSGEIDPSELREYRPGDPTNRIDWKATARLNEPYVREFEAETTRETLLLVDTRSTMATGPPGETKLDYARELALAFVESAAQLADPLGLVTVDDAGIGDAREPRSTSSQYRRLRSRLRDLSPGAEPSAEPSRGDLRGAETARRLADRLREADSAFATQLRPLLANSDRHVQRIEDRPLLSAVRRKLARTGDETWTVLVTDERSPAETREAVKLARRRGGAVLVCLLPGILYERGGLADLETACARYREFESYRRSLAGLDDVRALEVGPRDRVAAILAHERPSGGATA